MFDVQVPRKMTRILLNDYFEVSKATVIQNILQTMENSQFGSMKCETFWLRVSKPVFDGTSAGAGADVVVCFWYCYCCCCCFFRIHVPYSIVIQTNFTFNCHSIQETCSNWKIFNGNVPFTANMACSSASAYIQNQNTSIANVQTHTRTPAHNFTSAKMRQTA